MTEQTPSQPLANRALDRLRKLASGNGVDPAAITVFDVQEQVVTLKGKIFISPLCETESLAYVGAPRGKERRVLPTFAALQSAVAKHKQDFTGNADWTEAVVQELKTHENQGWGLQKAKVTLPERSAIYAATQTCPTCNGRQTLTCQKCLGRGTMTCEQCQGRGREWCYYCNGSGQDPHNPIHRCQTCDGTRYAPCRFCQARGYIYCPMCKGNRGTPCPNCRASGKMTQEVKVTCGGETRFLMEVEGLPSGLRKGLDRIGIANLGKGHADIRAEQPKETPDEDAEDKREKPVMLYAAVMPYAEMKMSFNGKKSIVSAVGKRCAIVGVPYFLDASLKPWIDKLRLAASGQGPLDDVLQARALKEILALVIAGNGTEKEARRYYPYGLSSAVLTSILADMKLAIKRATLTMRAIVAGICFVLSAAFFAFLFQKGAEARLTQGFNPFVVLGVDLASLALALGVSWGILNVSVRFALQRRFPQSALAFHQKIGKTGYVTLAAIVLAFGAMLWLAPVRPLWLQAIIAHL